MRVNVSAAAAALLCGALAAGGVEWTVRVKVAEVKPEPAPFARPVAELPLGEDFDGVQEGEWVRIQEKDRAGLVHRSAVALPEEQLHDPFMAARLSGTFYPEDVQEADAEVRAWMLNPVVRNTGPAPRAWELEEFRKSGGLAEGGK